MDLGIVNHASPRFRVGDFSGHSYRLEAPPFRDILASRLFISISNTQIARSVLAVRDQRLETDPGGMNSGKLELPDRVPSWSLGTRSSRKFCSDRVHLSSSRRKPGSSLSFLSGFRLSPE